ncbi:hypothetical protein [Halostreptopolyspora alba]|uniref:hypothetical protein n=1 Tax=Halostreptopolyspora alba TaxID=2487137 RepID=UPI0011CD44E0
MSEQEVAPKKEGIHGWRAFLLMFGCGTLAALLVFGSIVGVGKIIGSSFASSSSSGDDASGVESSREPRESVPPELLDLCELIELENLMGAAQGNRVDEKDDYVDSVTEGSGGPRTVSDSCDWEVVGNEGRNWSFGITYVAHMEGDDGKSIPELANNSFDEFVGNVNDEQVDSEGKVEGMEGRSRYFYESYDNQEDVYSFIRLSGSGVYQIDLKGVDVSRQEFRAEVVKVSSYIDGALERHTPD